MDALYVKSIFKTYKPTEHPSSTTLNELNFLLSNQFSAQQSSLLTSISIQQKENDVTHFASKQPLTVKSANSNDTTSALGVMEGKTTVTLYANNLKTANDIEKDSFYEAVFLKAMYGEHFEHASDGKLELKKSTLSIASLPENTDLKNEAMAQLAKFKKKYPNVEIKYDSLPQAEQDQLNKLLGNPTTTSTNTIKFNTGSPAPVTQPTTPIITGNTAALKGTIPPTPPKQSLPPTKPKPKPTEHNKPIHQDMCNELKQVVLKKQQNNTTTSEPKDTALKITALPIKSAPNQPAIPSQPSPILENSTKPTTESSKQRRHIIKPDVPATSNTLIAHQKQQGIQKEISDELADKLNKQRAKAEKQPASTHSSSTTFATLAAGKQQHREAPTSPSPQQSSAVNNIPTGTPFFNMAKYPAHTRPAVTPKLP